ncbi:hypothetical protein EDB84DRAFT_1557898 [Lactarius hengduanensis]|nr:hypothetical protein EDB84DRAFT_1557898 [Lactarius hengduanensis]
MSLIPFGDFPKDFPAASDAVGGPVDTIMSAVKTSLGILKEASSLASKVPCISSIAGMLLYAIQVHSEVRQFKEEWAIVAQRLLEVANIVISVGKSCETHGLGEEDLAHLETALQPLQKSLEAIGRMLRECAEYGVIKKVLQRADIQTKVKQCDAMLSHALNVFQAKLTLHIHFTQLIQLIQSRPVNAVAITVNSSAGSTSSSRNITSVLSKAPKPSAPQLFFGRDAELNQILDMIFGPRPARIAILGPGGYGKTTLASAVLAHRRIRERFGDARYFVACESATTSADLMVELAKALGLLEAGDASWSHIKTSLTKKKCIICLDNFESPWDQAAEIRNSVEDLLSKITSLRSVTVLVTMRGTERPDRTHWTQPALAPLKTLDDHAAQVAWQRIANNFDSFAEQLIAAVDNVPLAVNVLAHLAQATSPALLLKEWKEKYTRLVQRGHSHKLSNMESSIQLSLNSKRMRDNPAARELLGVLSVLPDGIHTELLDKFKGVLDIDILSCLRALQQCSLVEVTAERYRSHSIIRHFCLSQGLLLPWHEELLNNFYIALAMTNRYQAGCYDYAEMVLEANNTKATLSRLLKSNYQDQSMLVNAVLTFVNFCINIGDYSDQLLDEAVKFIQQNHLPISLQIGCLQRWGRLHYRTHDLENAKLKLQQAEMLCLSSLNHDPILHAKILRDLGDICLDQGATSGAEAVFQKALQLSGAANDALGQGNCYAKLGGIYMKLRKLHEAGAAYSKALEFHKALDDNVGQGSDYRGLGDIQLQLQNFNDAESSYQKALEFDKLANSVRGQAKDYKALGNTYLKKDKLEEAEAFFDNALGLYKAINSSSGQGSILYDLAKIYLKRSQLKDARTAIERALDMHKQAQDKAGEKLDQRLLDQILSRDGAVVADGKRL